MKNIHINSDDNYATPPELYNLRHNIPFQTYEYTCKCGYTIMESEWNKNMEEQIKMAAVVEIIEHRTS